MNFQKANNITGWIAFAVALITYWLTFEETASYWDCGEFIAVSYKLEVPHPPGAPLFLMLGRVFSFLAMGDVTKVAYWINVMSVLASAFTVLFMFWSIVLFGRKILGVKKESDITPDQTWMLMGAGLVGSLAYTFSDSFWFSAVEAEVYAMSSFFTAFVVWGVLKWDVIEDESKANRWLVLVFYMIGLSIGVHLLNLVTLPALGLLYYFKKYKDKVTVWGVLSALAISSALVLFINDFIVPGLPSLAGNFEIAFVNTLGLPFGSGAAVFSLILIGALVFGLRYSQRKEKAVLNTFLLATTFILIGYCSYAAIVIRSNFNTPINENAPKDVMSFVRYLKREQYGSRPLITGPYFTARPIGVEYGAPVYTKGKDRYEITETKFSYEYEPGEVTLLPRAWSSEHAESYRNIMGLAQGQKPTFVQDKKYMFSQQIGWMYVRYFLWNFAGREGDDQGSDWLGPTDWFRKVPAVLAENKGRNNFFMIPLVLGLFGMAFQFIRDSKGFSVVALLFIMTGVAIVVYLNSPPVEPRERDYIYAGSTYAFAFWIGLAVIGLAELIGTALKNLRNGAVIATIIGLVAPVIMAQQGWDDHNRSNRFFSVDSGKNYLNSCAPNSILFTGGDNDTFMLWYAQEVENVRTDVRVIVLSYYNTDWYVEQTMQKSYLSEPFPYTLSLKDYQQGGPNDYLRFSDMKIKSIDLKQYLDLLHKNYPQLRVDGANIVPSRTLTLNIDKADLIRRGIIPKGMDSLVVDHMEFKLTKGSLEKKDLAFLDVLATNNWERPIYVNHTSMAQFNFNLEDYAVLEGNAYRILPIMKPNPDKDFVNQDVAYDNMIHKFEYRGLDNDKLYYTEDYKGFVLNHRSSLNSLAESLVESGDLKKAQEVLLFSLAKMPDKVIPYDHTAVTMVDLLFKVGEKDKAVEMATLLGDRANEMTSYLIKRKDLGLELRRNLYILGNLYQILYKNGENDLAKKLEDYYNTQLESAQIFSGGGRRRQ